MKTPFGDIRTIPGDKPREIYYNAEDVVQALGLDNYKLKEILDSGINFEVIYDAELKALFFSKQGLLTFIECAKRAYADDEDTCIRLTRDKAWFANNL